MSALDDDGYRAFRRDLHRNPEPAWREFYTTARIVEELRERDHGTSTSALTRWRPTTA